MSSSESYRTEGPSFLSETSPRLLEVALRFGAAKLHLSAMLVRKCCGAAFPSSRSAGLVSQFHCETKPAQRCACGKPPARSAKQSWRRFICAACCEGSLLQGLRSSRVRVFEEKPCRLLRLSLLQGLRSSRVLEKVGFFLELD